MTVNSGVPRKVASSRGLWQATTALLVGLIVLAVVLALAGPVLSAELGTNVRLLIGLALTIVPALLWLGIFYTQDRLEPEPHQYVLGLLLLGALLGGAIGQPLVRDIFGATEWVDRGTLTHLASATFLEGILTATLTYAAIRFTVMPTSEFDERIDGIIYGTAVALGLGIAANLTYITDNGTISIGVGTLTIIITSLAYATFGAVVGYFLGLIKPGGGPGWLAGVGVLAAGVLHGLYEWIAGQDFAPRELSYNPWPTLIATTVFVVISFALVFFLIQRTYARPAAPSGGLS